MVVIPLVMEELVEVEMVHHVVQMVQQAVLTLVVVVVEQEIHPMVDLLQEEMAVQESLLQKN